MDENQKPQVFPTPEQIAAANAAGDAIDKQRRMQGPTQGEIAAAEEMRRRTEEQLRLREERLAEEKRIALARRQELTEIAEKEGQYYIDQKARAEELANRPTVQTQAVYSSPATSPKPKTPAPAGYRPVQLPVNQTYDLIPIPSEGKIYPLRKSKFKVAFLNASDENLLTSPNLLESGDWFEILLSRKILEDINPKDLHMGDRNAIMIWLRATSYGEMYPINIVNPRTGKVVLDPVTNEPWNYEVDLSKLKIKKLGAEPDIHGLFTYILPKSQKTMKFRFLTVRDIEELTAIEDYELNVLGLEYANTLTYRLDRQIIEIDGNRDPDFIRNEILTMNPKDSSAFRKYNDEIESGVDLKIDVRIPGGESIKSFLPLNINFFWPDFSF